MMKSHDEVQELLPGYNELDVADQREVERHVGTCAVCAAEMDKYQRINRELAHLHSPAPDPRARQALHTSLTSNRPHERAWIPRWPTLSARRAAPFGVAILALFLVVSFAVTDGFRHGWWLDGKGWPPTLMKDAGIARQYLEQRGYKVVSYEGTAETYELTRDKLVRMPYILDWGLQTVDPGAYLGKAIRDEKFMVTNHPLDNWKMQGQSEPAQPAGRTIVHLFMTDHQPVGAISLPDSEALKTLDDAFAFRCCSLEGKTLEEVHPPARDFQAWQQGWVRRFTAQALSREEAIRKATAEARLSRPEMGILEARIDRVTAEQISFAEADRRFGGQTGAGGYGPGQAPNTPVWWVAVHGYWRYEGMPLANGKPDIHAANEQDFAYDAIDGSTLGSGARDIPSAASTGTATLPGPGPSETTAPPKAIATVGRLPTVTPNPAWVTRMDGSPYMTAEGITFTPPDGWYLIGRRDSQDDM